MPKLIDLTEFVRLPRPKLEWTIHRLVPRPGTVVLMGPPKVGKSYLALQVALAVARGEAFLGQATVQGVVWYLQLDTSEFMWRTRIQDLQEAGIDMSGPVRMAQPLDIPRPYNVMTAAFQSFMRDSLEKDDPSLVIVDVLRKIHSSDENDSTEMKRVFDVLNDILVSRSVLIVHHTKKIRDDIENPDPNTLSRGSSFITGEADALWLLWNRRMRVSSRFDEDRTYACNQTESGLWHFSDEMHIAEAQRKVLALCDEFPHLTHNKIADLAKERWSMSRATYYRYIGGLECPHTKHVAASEVHKSPSQHQLGNVSQGDETQPTKEHENNHEENRKKHLSHTSPQIVPAALTSHVGLQGADVVKDGAFAVSTEATPDTRPPADNPPV